MLGVGAPELMRVFKLLLVKHLMDGNGVQNFGWGNSRPVDRSVFLAFLGQS